MNINLCAPDQIPFNIALLCAFLIACFIAIRLDKGLDRKRKNRNYKEYQSQRKRMIKF
jgi:hypothetical protein